MFTFGSPFVLFVSAYIGMQKMWEEQSVFPGMRGVTVGNVLPADLVFFTPLRLHYSTPALAGRRSFHFCSSGFLQLHLCLCSRISVLDDLICPGFLPSSPDSKKSPSLSHPFQLIYSPEPNRVHYLICSLKPKRCICSFSHSTVSV